MHSCTLVTLSLGFKGYLISIAFLDPGNLEADLQVGIIYIYVCVCVCVISLTSLDPSGWRIYRLATVMGAIDCSYSRICPPKSFGSIGSSYWKAPCCGL